ncbi:MAG: hypothetical protein Q8L84_10420 [Hyphomonas sp.]|nr:hypothetical protein [Hyphomonas sp.]
MTDTGDLLSIAAAALALTTTGDKISRQGLSKYCEQHGLKTETPNGPRVSLAAVRAHRAANYQREVMSGAPVAPPPAAPPAPRPAPAESRDQDAGGDIVELSPSRRLKELQVEQAEIANAKARDELVLADEVTAGIADIIAGLRQQMFQAIPDAAQRLAAELSLGSEDERLIRAAMKQAARDTLQSFVSAAAQANADLTHEPPRETRIRLGRLAMMAARMRARPQRYLAALEGRAAG